MDHSNENMTKNGWSEYGRLVLAELKRLNEGQENLRINFDDKFNTLNQTIIGFENTETEVEVLKEWRDKVIDVWSASQMKEAKDQIYKQKGYFQKLTGVIIILQVLLTLLSIFKDNIF